MDASKGEKFEAPANRTSARTKTTMEPNKRAQTSMGDSATAKKRERRPTIDLTTKRPSSAMGGAKSMIQVIGTDPPVENNQKTGPQSFVAPVGGASFLKAPTAVKEVITGNVKVFCRFRPLNQRELDTADDLLCVQFKDEKTCSVKGINKNTGSEEPIDYNFDYVFDLESMQENVYKTAVMPIINSVLEGFNGSIMAYGQTSSGKTHTMLGPSIDDEENKGIIPRMVGGIFEQIESAAEDIEFSVKVSFIEIYNEKIRDLLNPEKVNLKIHENKDKGVYVRDMTETYVGQEDEVFQILKIGNENRAIGVTDMNSQSSRSHSVFILQVEQKNVSDFSSKTGKIYLVDLAGSERLSKTGVQGAALKEAQNINKSLTTLGIVINKLTDGKSTHIPYRDSKLTQILQESLGGNSKTALVITCSPSIFNKNETISTLKFGMRAKQIKNNAKVNKELSIKELKHLLKLAEQEIIIKNKKIEKLTAYVEQLEANLEGMTPEQRAELAEQRQKLLEEQRLMDMALQDAQNMQPGETIIESQAEVESMSDENDFDDFESQSQITDGSVLSPAIGNKHAFLDSAISGVGSLPQTDFSQLRIENVQTEEIDDAEIIKMPREQSDTFKSILQSQPDSQPQSPTKAVVIDVEQTPVRTPEQPREKEPILNSTIGTPLVVGQLEMIEEEQSFDEKELLNANGEFMIFAQEEEALEQHIPTDNSTQIDSSKNDTSAVGKELEVQPTLEANFDKLNYTNKIQILLKALMMEREKNRENMIRLNVMKQQYIKKVQMVKSHMDESEQLIEKVAQYEITIDEKNEEINNMTDKKNEYKNRMQNLQIKEKDLREMLDNSENGKKEEVAIMEKRIEQRVQKIILDKESSMKKEKKMIMDKYQQYATKIKSQKAQIDELKQASKKQNQIYKESQGETFENTVNKLNNSEKCLDQLKTMYHNIASSKEAMKRDLVVYEKKYKRKSQEYKALGKELQTTRLQVATFRQKFQMLTKFITKKGGIDMLNGLPTAPGYKNGGIKDEFEEFLDIKSGNANFPPNMRDSLRPQKASMIGNQNDISMISSSDRKVIKGRGAPSVSDRNVMRGGTAVTRQSMQQERPDESELNQSISPSN